MYHLHKKQTKSLGVLVITIVNTMIWLITIPIC